MSFDSTWSGWLSGKGPERIDWRSSSAERELVVMRDWRASRVFAPRKCFRIARGELAIEFSSKGSGVGSAALGAGVDGGVTEIGLGGGAVWKRSFFLVGLEGASSILWA